MVTLKLRYFKPLFVFFLIAGIGIMGCRTDSTDETNITPQTPVEISTISKGSISENITLNATSTYQRKHTIKSFVPGYIKNVKCVIGQYVKQGEVLFTLTTKEAEAYNSLNIKDTSFLKPQAIVVKATSNGIISTIDHQSGEYVLEGDQLCTISEPESMVFILEVPYELHDYAKINSNCTIKLPDGKELEAKIISMLPQVDTQSQTQKLIIKPLENYSIPENLVATISLLKSVKTNATIVPKQAILTDEVQSEFWVMKLINDSTAVKTPVQIGIKNQDKVEIIEPQFKEHDRILVSGNYGLADTAGVKVIKSDK